MLSQTVRHFHMCTFQWHGFPVCAVAPRNEFPDLASVDVGQDRRHNSHIDIVRFTAARAVKWWEMGRVPRTDDLRQVGGQERGAPMTQIAPQHDQLSISRGIRQGPNRFAGMCTDGEMRDRHGDQISPAVSSVTPRATTTS